MNVGKELANNLFSSVGFQGAPHRPVAAVHDTADCLVYPVAQIWLSKHVPGSV